MAVPNVVPQKPQQPNPLRVVHPNDAKETQKEPAYAIDRLAILLTTVYFISFFVSSWFATTLEYSNKVTIPLLLITGILFYVQFRYRKVHTLNFRTHTFILIAGSFIITAGQLAYILVNFFDPMR